MAETGGERPFRGALLRAWVSRSIERQEGTNLACAEVLEAASAAASAAGLAPPTSAALGKAVRAVIPEMTRRRLGPRGNSKRVYCDVAWVGGQETPVAMELELDATSAAHSSAAAPSWAERYLAHTEALLADLTEGHADPEDAIAAAVTRRAAFWADPPPHSDPSGVVEDVRVAEQSLGVVFCESLDADWGQVLEAHAVAVGALVASGGVPPEPGAAILEAAEAAVARGRHYAGLEEARRLWTAMTAHAAHVQSAAAVWDAAQLGPAPPAVPAPPTSPTEVLLRGVGAALLEVAPCEVWETLAMDAADAVPPVAADAAAVVCAEVADVFAAACLACAHPSDPEATVFRTLQAYLPRALDRYLIAARVFASS